MKTRLWKLTIAALLIAIWSQAYSRNSLVFVTPGTSFQIATTGNRIGLVLQNADEIKALQLKVVSNTPGVVLVELQRGSRTLGQGWTVQYHNVSEGRMNVLIANLGNDIFQAGEGAIAEIVFDVKESMEGEFFTLSLEEIKAADTQGKRVELVSEGDATLAVNNGVNVEFVVNPLAVSLSIGNRGEISGLRFEARLEGATSISQPVLRVRAEGMQLRFEQFSDHIVVELNNSQGVSIKPGNGEILEIAVQSPNGVRLVVQGMSLVGSNNMTLESRVSVVEPTQQPQLYVLNQNYPNPFNPSTTISYDLRTPTDVTLKVYDAMGQEVATLVRDEQPAGTYALLWNGTDDNGAVVSSGTYVYRLTAGESSTTKKMVLLK